MSVVFFTDRDLGLEFPGILRGAGLTVERHRDHFPHDCPDETWLAAVVQHKVTLLVTIGQVPYAKLARNFVNTLPRVLAFLASSTPPVIAKVYRPSPADVAQNSDAPGRIEQWYPPLRARKR